jgi:hypothetical protein
MPAAFRELFESFMNVCISVLIISLFATPALVPLPNDDWFWWMENGDFTACRKNKECLTNEKY